MGPSVLILLLLACTWEDQLMEAGMEVVAVAEEEIEGVEVQVHTTEVGEEDQGLLCIGEEGVHLPTMEEETTEVVAEATLLEDTNQIKKSALNVYNNKSHLITMFVLNIVF